MNLITDPFSEPGEMFTFDEELFAAEQEPLRCMIVDDELHAINLLERHIELTPSLRLLHSATSVMEILTRAEKQPFDLLFLDVEMPLLTGFELLNMLKGKCQFILCSGHQGYALKGFEHDVCDYLLKPVTYSRFIKAVDKAKQQSRLRQIPGMMKQNETHKEYLFLKGDRKHRYLRIRIDEIDYIKGVGHYITIVMNKEKKTIQISIKQILKYLPPDKFIRVHHSYVVLLKKIAYVDFEELGLHGVSVPIPISNRYRPEVLRRLKKESYS